MVEDNDADVLLIKHALQLHEVSHSLARAADGAQAVTMIRSLGEPNGIPCPDLMLLDLNLPKVPGSEVLAEFRMSKLCADTPAIVMSSSGSGADRARVESLGISYYFQKPSSLDDFMQLGKLVAQFVTIVGSFCM